MQFPFSRMIRFDAARFHIISLCLLSLWSGCQGTGNVELLEAQLRENEVLIQKYERELGQMHSQLSIAQREASLLRKQLKSNGQPIPAVEATTSIAAVESLQFNKLLTAAQDKDDSPGDEKFHAIVTPEDGDGELVKVLGKLHIEAIDLGRPEGERTIGKWEFTPEEAEELWHSGYLSSGYRFEFPWQSLPAGNEVVLHVSLETPDGRQLATSHTLKVEPATSVATKSMKKNPRPEPVLDLTEVSQGTPNTDKETLAVTPISFEKKSIIAPPEENETSARPFPTGVQTSDNWTDATIPRLR